MKRPRSAVRIRPRTAGVLVVASLIGMAAFAWPLLIDPGSGLEHSTDAPWIFAGVLPLLLAVIAAELSEHGLDAKAIAMLGVLTAVGAAMRPLGGGATGFQPMFVVLILGGYAFGAGFGFALGAITMFASALLTGGVGPWLPFQMLAAAWVGMFAGLLPQVRPSAERWLLAAYGAISALAFGLMMNLSFWPWATWTATSVGYVAGDPVNANLTRFIAFHLTTSMAWDLTRAIGNVVLILIVGRPVLNALRRANRRAAFHAAPTFEPASVPQSAVAATRAMP